MQVNKTEFDNLLKDLNLSCNEQIYQSLSTYAKFLLEYNEHTNLTAIKEEKQVFIKHFYDSLTLTKMINLKTTTTLLDIGTGAGFPGIVLKIFYPDIHITLIDSNNKKIKFLEELIKKLDLKNIEVLNIRAEELAKTKLNYYDIVTARAVANLRVLTEISVPLVKKGGAFIALKGTAENEITQAKNTIKKMNCEINNIIKLTLPIEQSQRTLIKIVKKENHIKEKLRPYSKILKTELK